MQVEYIEILLVVLIVLGQAGFGYITYRRIEEFNDVLLPFNRFSIRKIYIKLESVNTIPPRQLLSQLKEYAIERDDIIDDEKNYAGISLISASTWGSEAQQSILENINTYLIRNRSAVADFNLVKDIVERTADAIEEEVNSTISVPLYLGLLGTLLGIIFGLFNISNIGADAKALDVAIAALLNGVKIAMIASFIGLLLTVINSAFFLRLAKTLVERRKNDFYSFIQVELLPVLNQSVNSSLSSLQVNLHKFNEDFSGNLNLLGELMFKNHDAILAQEKVLTALESIDISEFAKANVKVLKELQKSIDSFQSFNLYVGAVNEALNNTKEMVSRISELISRSENMNSLAENINKSFAENNRLITFFNDHRTGLDESKALLRESVGGVSKSLKDAIGELNETTLISIGELRQMVTREIRIMNDEYPRKWDKLDNLEEIKSGISKMVENHISTVTRLEVLANNNNSALKEIKEQLVVLNEHKSNLSFIDYLRKRMKGAAN